MTCIAVSDQALGRDSPRSFRHALRMVCSLLGGLLLGLFAAALPCPAEEDPASPLSPQDALRQFQLQPGLVIELVAAEPDVVDPVSIAFDEDRRMYVVEMRDYPTGPKSGGPPLSRIRLLEDADRDGRYETARLFAEELLFATGVQPWRGGVIVTLAGEIAYFKDTDGDGRADLRQTWFHGFVEENPQLRANHPTFALDNHVYVANGLRGGTIVPEESTWGRRLPEVSIANKDFRFNPLTGECEAVAGHGQFGLAFDDFGNRFVCDNRHPCRHVVLEDRYTRRNPFLAVSEVVHDVCAADAQSRILPISRAWTTSNLHAGQFTAACGLTIYRGDALPADHYGNAFVCDPTGNLVHREVLTRGGRHAPGQSQATFYGAPADPRREFLATKDEWFRPVDLTTGPDGGLYVVDMYRAVIEHPEWVPEELKNRPDAWLGNDRGRIYRIVPEQRDAPTGEAPARLSGASSTELVSLLSHGNGWQRDTAARLLYERQDRSVAADLERVAPNLAREPRSAVARVRALWTLEGLAALSDDFLTRAVLNEGLPNAEGIPVRMLGTGLEEQALVLLERRLRARPLADDSPVLQALLGTGPLGQAESLRLNPQRLLTLGELPDSGTKAQALARGVAESPGDRWLRRAAWTAVGDRPDLVFGHLISLAVFGKDPPRPEFAAAVRELAEVIGARREPREIGPVLASLIELRLRDSRPDRHPAQRVMLSGWNGLGQGLARRGDALAAVLVRLEEQEQGIRAGMRPLFDDALALAQDQGTPLELRREALSALRHMDFEQAGPPLLALATQDADQTVRLTSLDALSTFRDPQIAGRLLESFSRQTPAVRRMTLSVLLRDADRTRTLLGEIAAARLPPTELDPLSVQALLNHGDAAIREAARRELAALQPADRRQVLAEYQRALSLPSDPARGRQVFEKNCANCHRIAGLGVDVAPDISDSRTKTAAQILNDILNPNQAIDNNYVSYTVVTADGQTHAGVISAETPASVTLRMPEGKSVQLLRQDIDELRSSGVSLMPEGLEKNIPVEQMADLLSFIKNWRYLDGAVPREVISGSK